MMAELTAESFEALDGDMFAVTSVEPVQQLRLIEVQRKGKGERMGGSFSLLWQSDNEVVLPQGSYMMKNDTLGEVELFIVPVGQASEGVHYEAVFT
ncbi:MAG: DUF6916 family protein [Hoeflea sp.]|uniref:DUF6916 family protein n=1 Tax=Hoeflea sp. TaxID=1940281 RepID=UPI003EF37E46